MSCESTVLQWKNYTRTASEAFQRLYEATNFTDVTIACEDNEKIEAHKVILSMCSNLFTNILKDNPTAENFKAPPKCKKTFEKEISATIQNINPLLILKRNEKIKTWKKSLVTQLGIT